jgi:hypothetical protein
MDDLKQFVNLWIYLFAVLGVLFLGYVLIEGQAYQALAIFAFLVGLGMYWRLSGS